MSAANGDPNVPRYMTHQESSRPKFQDMGHMREITPKPTCILRHHMSDAKPEHRTVTPKREAMWRNFSGSQASLATGHGLTAHVAAQPVLAPPTIAEIQAAERDRKSPLHPLNRGGGGYLPLNASGTLNSSTSQRSSTPQPLSPALKSHWSANPTSTSFIPVEKNSAHLGESRADTIVRSAPFPHHKNMVFPQEDPTVDTRRDRLWMNRPLRNGSMTATRKRTYDVPTFRGSDESTTVLSVQRIQQQQQAAGRPSTTFTTNNQNNNNSFLASSDNNNLNSSRISNNSNVVQQQHQQLNNNNNTNISNNSVSSVTSDAYHFSKKKIPQPQNLEGAAGHVTEEVQARRFMVRPLAPHSFKPPYNETGDIVDKQPEEIPQAAKVLGKRKMSPMRVGPTTQCEGGWSDQPVDKARGTRHYPYNFGNSKDFPISDSPPKPDELPKFRPSVVVMHGAPAFVPTLTRPSSYNIGGGSSNSATNSPMRSRSPGGIQQQLLQTQNHHQHASQPRAGTPQGRHSNLSPIRRCAHTPRDHDIFGAKEQRQPWHPQPAISSLSRAVELTPAPGSVEIKRCKGVGQYSPMRITPQYRF
jgi:hypothetical protein